MFGLAALAALASMAFLGAGTASAEGIAICEENALPCPENKLVSLIHAELEAGTVGQLLSSLATILCLNVLAEAHAEGPLLHATTLNAIILATFTGCGSNGAHSNCTVKTLENGLAELTKTGTNLGVISGTSGEEPGVVNLQCTILGFPVNCDYSGAELAFPVEGAGHTEGAGNGRLVANKTPAKLTEALGGLFCPENSTLDAKLVASEAIYITG